MITISYSERLNDMSIEDKEALSQSPAHWGTAPRLTREEVIELAKAKDAGSIEARNKLVEHNMQLVIKIARSWAGRGVPFEDLVQEGAIGLMRATDLFDWTRGNEFSTFAGLRIVAACQRAVENYGEAIRIPVHTRSSGRCQEEAARAKRVLSGNKPVHRDTTAMGRETELFDLIKGEANTESDAIATVSAIEARAALTRALDSLNEKEREIIQLRFLSGGFEPMPMHIVGAQVGITKQRVEQIQKTAFAKLRAVLSEASHVN